MTDKELKEWEEEYKDVQKDIRWLLPLEIIIILIAILI
tara:strand:- start:249 stop:362 length:114 start_codon:yes stop_codon:yes gene_type:complete